MAAPHVADADEIGEFGVKALKALVAPEAEERREFGVAVPDDSEGRIDHRHRHFGQSELGQGRGGRTTHVDMKVWTHTV
jgi:hypothetical protein